MVDCKPFPKPLPIHRYSSHQRRKQSEWIVLAPLIVRPLPSLFVSFPSFSFVLFLFILPSPFPLFLFQPLIFRFHPFHDCYFFFLSLSHLFLLTLLVVRPSHFLTFVCYYVHVFCCFSRPAFMSLESASERRQFFGRNSSYGEYKKKCICYN